jgi:hypothetical protein
MNALFGMIQRIGHLIRELNEKFYFYLDIETSISWTVVFLMWALYRIVKRFFNDQKLSSDELVKLLAIYMIFLVAIMCSYTDFKEITEKAHPEYSFFVITLFCVGVVIALAWGGATENPVRKKRMILIALYTPIILLIISNGRIIEERFGYVKTFLPRTDISFINLPGEIEKLFVGGLIENKDVVRVETIVNSHKAVNECAVVGYQDQDKLVKPYALVILKPGNLPSKELQQKIMTHVDDVIMKNKIPSGMVPYWIEFIEREKMPRPGRGNIHHTKIEQILNTHKAVRESAMVPHPDKSTAYVALKDGFSESRALGREIMDYLLKEIKEHNKISPYMKPYWVSFMDKDDVPRTSSGKIDHRKLQKKIKNWSNIFPSAPAKNPFEKIK